MNIVEKKLNDIKPYDKNARKNDDAESIRQFGFKVPIILHNHPSGGHFSDADLISTSMDARSKGIVATSTKAQYTFEKGTHFKATQFVKAVKSAKLKGTSYDDAVDKWLKGNAKKYGYKYTKQK